MALTQITNPNSPLQGLANGGFSVELINFDAMVVALGDEMTPKLLMAAALATENEVEHNFQISQDLVPIGPTGQLRASGRKLQVETLAGTVSAGAAYGGPAGSGTSQTEDVDYAIYVHEDLTTHHRFGQAKFLEGPFRGAIESGKGVERMRKDINRFMDQAMRGWW